MPFPFRSAEKRDGLAGELENFAAIRKLLGELASEQSLESQVGKLVTLQTAIVQLTGEPPRKRGERGPSRGGDDAVKRQIAAALRELKKTDRKKWIRITLEMAGVSLDEEDTSLEAQLARFARLRDVIGSADKADRSDEMKEWAQALMIAAPQIIATLRGQPLAVVQQVPQIETAAPVTETPAPQPAGDNVVQISLESQFVIAKVKTLGSAEAAADYLLRMEDKTIKHFLERLHDSTTDEQVGEIVAEFLAEKPEFSGAFAWLQRQPELLGGIVRHVRERSLVRQTGL